LVTVDAAAPAAAVATPAAFAPAPPAMASATSDTGFAMATTREGPWCRPLTFLNGTVTEEVPGCRTTRTGTPRNEARGESDAVVCARHDGTAHPLAAKPRMRRGAMTPRAAAGAVDISRKTYKLSFFFRCGQRGREGRA
jgi:hypothetical protein